MPDPPIIVETNDPKIAAVQGTHTGGGSGVHGVGTTNGPIGTSTGTGVFGESVNGPGVSGQSTDSVGVDARSEKGPAAMRAIGTGNTNGVIGQSTGSGFGVFGESQSSAGVSGQSTDSVGVDARSEKGPAGLRAIGTGNTNGVIGQSTDGIGVFGSSDTGQGVVGTSNRRPGVEGQGKSFVGVWGESHGNAGVFGFSHKSPFAGVSGKNDSNDPTGIGVLGECAAGIGVFGKGRLAGRFEGVVEVTADIRLTGGQDCAEDFEVSSTEHADAGTVMVITEEGTLACSEKAYDKRVAGVISGAGNYKPGIILGRETTHSSRVPVALIGRVYCKVDAEYSSIQVGDLLTTSPTPGHAMRAEDPLKAFGAVVGKALHGIKGGQGLIPILVALQ